MNTKIPDIIQVKEHYLDFFYRALRICSSPGLCVAKPTVCTVGVEMHVQKKSPNFW